VAYTDWFLEDAFQMSFEITPGSITIPDAMLQKWQSVVDILAELIHVPAGLIMRVVDSDIEVFVSSQSEGNPYSPRDIGRITPILNST
jgi:hypothetical protein